MEEEMSVVEPQQTAVPETNVVEVETPETRADRIRNLTKQPDYSVPDIQTLDDIMLESPMPMAPELAHKMVDMAQIKKDAGEQSAIVVENFLTDLGGLGDKASLAFGQYVNLFTGGTIGNELNQAAFDSMMMRLEDMGYAEDSVGGVRSLLAQLVGGTLSMTELALVGLASGGYGALAQMGVESLGQAAFNDMKKYAEEHDGDMTGYVASVKDVALNTANAMLQVAIERNFGVGSPRFLHGMSRGFWKEGLSGAAQEFSQDVLSDFNEYLKGNIEAQDAIESVHQWIQDGVVGGVLQGVLGAATHWNARNNAKNGLAKEIAKSNGRETPNEKDMQLATKYVNNIENQEVSALTSEIVDGVDEQTAGDKTPEKLEKTITAIGRKINELGGSTATEKDGVITVTSSDEKGKLQSEIYVNPETAENSEFYTPDSEFKTESGKKSASKVQQTLRKTFGDKIDVQKLDKMDTKATVAKATNRIHQDKQSVIDLLNDENANKLDRAAAYHALAQEITSENDIDLLNTLSDPKIAKFGRELGQAVALLDIKSDTGFNVIEVARAMRAAKGEMTEQQLNNEIASMGIFEEEPDYKSLFFKNKISENLDQWEKVKYSSLLGEGGTYAKGKRSTKATEAEKNKFFKKMIEKYRPELAKGGIVLSDKQIKELKQSTECEL